MTNFEIAFLKSVEQIVSSVSSPLDFELESTWRSILIDFSSSLCNAASIVLNLQRKSLKK